MVNSATTRMDDTVRNLAYIGTWSMKKFVGDNSKLSALALEAMRYAKEKKSLDDVKDDILLLCNYVKDIATGRYKGYKTWNLTVIIAALLYIGNANGTGWCFSIPCASIHSFHCFVGGLLGGYVDGEQAILERWHVLASST